jgi:hypothetical protein
MILVPHVLYQANTIKHKQRKGQTYRGDKELMRKHSNVQHWELETEASGEVACLECGFEFLV